MFRKTILDILKSAENTIANDSNFTANRTWTIMKYYIPFMPTPTKVFDMNEYEKRVKKHVEKSPIAFSNEEKKNIISELAALRNVIHPYPKLKLYKSFNDLAQNNHPSDLHIIAGTVSRPVIIGLLISLGSRDLLSSSIFMTIFGVIYYAVKVDMLVGHEEESVITHTNNITKLLDKSDLISTQRRLEKDFGLVNEKQMIATENWDRLRYYEKQCDEDAVVIFPKNTYDDGK